MRQKPDVLIAACLNCATLKHANGHCPLCNGTANTPGTVRKARRL